MIAVIFEVWPKADRKQDYLRIAAELKPLLEEIDGFISIERFESLYEPGKFCRFRFFEMKWQYRPGERQTNIASRRRKAVARFFPIIVCASLE